MGNISSDTVALITGGSRGIGFAAARQLGLLGATIVLLGRDADGANRAAHALNVEGIDAHPVIADVSEPHDLAEAKERLGALGDPDVLVLSAGVMAERMTKTLRTTPQEWRRVLGANLDGAFFCVEAFGQGMAQRRSGRIIGVSACLGRMSGPGTSGGLAPYRVSKAGLNAMLRNLAAEMQWGARGILVDAMCPGHCRTDMGGPDAPRSAAQGADTIVWLADRDAIDAAGAPVTTGVLWEDRQVVPW